MEYERLLTYNEILAELVTILQIKKEGTPRLPRFCQYTVQYSTVATRHTPHETWSAAAACVLKQGGLRTAMLVPALAPLDHAPRADPAEARSGGTHV